jgi:hypothetical protein
MNLSVTEKDLMTAPPHVVSARGVSLTVTAGSPQFQTKKCKAMGM